MNSCYGTMDARPYFPKAPYFSRSVRQMYYGIKVHHFFFGAPHLEELYSFLNPKKKKKLSKSGKAQSNQQKTVAQAHTKQSFRQDRKRRSDDVGL